MVYCGGTEVQTPTITGAETASFVDSCLVQLGHIIDSVIAMLIS